MLDLRRLRTLREVVEQRSFSAAALELDYTQSNVSHQIAGLERELGVALIDRASRPINPTPAGEFVLARAETLLDGAAALERELREVARGEAGLLRMGGFFTAWATFVPGAVSAFSRARPRVQLELEQLEPEIALPRVQAGDLDVAVTYRARASSTPAIGSPGRICSTTTSRLRFPPTIGLPGKRPWSSRTSRTSSGSARPPTTLTPGCSSGSAASTAVLSPR